MMKHSAKGRNIAGGYWTRRLGYPFAYPLAAEWGRNSQNLDL